MMLTFPQRLWTSPLTLGQSVIPHSLEVSPQSCMQIYHLNHGCIFVGSTVLLLNISETCYNAHAHKNLHNKYWACPHTIELSAVLKAFDPWYVRSHGRSSYRKNTIRCKCSPSALCTTLSSTNGVSNNLFNRN